MQLLQRTSSTRPETKSRNLHPTNSGVGLERLGCGANGCWALRVAARRAVAIGGGGR
jgi:hypothetical protein